MSDMVRGRAQRADGMPSRDKGRQRCAGPYQTPVRKHTAPSPDRAQTEVHDPGEDDILLASTLHCLPPDQHPTRRHCRLPHPNKTSRGHRTMTSLQRRRRIRLQTHFPLPSAHPIASGVTEGKPAGAGIDLATTWLCGSQSRTAEYRHNAASQETAEEWRGWEICGK